MSKGISYIVAILACIMVMVIFSLIMAVANLRGTLFYIIMFATCTVVWKSITSLAKKDKIKKEEEQDDKKNT